MRHRWNLGIWLGVVGLLVGCGQRDNLPPVVVGHVAPLTGASANRGAAARDGIALAVDAINTDGGVQGRRLEVVHADSKSEPELAGLTGVRLLSVNRVVALVGSPIPAEESALVRTDRTYGAPVVGVSGLGSEAGDPVIPLAEAIRVREQILARFALDQLGATRAVLFVPASNEHGQECGGDFQESWQSRTGALPLTIHLPLPGRTESLVARLREYRPEVIAFAVTGSDVQSAEVLLEEADLRAPRLLLSDDGPAPGSPTSTGRVTYHYASFWAEATEESRAFAKSFRERFGREPTDDAALGWEAVQLLTSEFSSSDPEGQSNLLSSLKAMDQFRGLTGTVHLKRKEGQRRPTFVLKTDGAKRTLAWKVDADADPEQKR